jgi:hypothetical protein
MVTALLLPPVLTLMRTSESVHGLEALATCAAVVVVVGLAVVVVVGAAVVGGAVVVEGAVVVVVLEKAPLAGWLEERVATKPRTTPTASKAANTDEDTAGRCG